MKKLLGLVFVLLAGLVLFTGCASTEKATTKTTIDEMKAPEWVTKGSGAFGGDSGKVFYGVASASNMSNSSLLRSAADNRARNEVAKIFQVYTASLMKDYAASTIAGDPNVISEEQHVEQAIKTVTSMTLSGVEIVDHWKDPATMELYSLARLNLDTFKDNIDKIKELNEKVKNQIKQNAEKLHEELEKEEEKMSAK